MPMNCKGKIKMADVRFVNHGSLVGIHALSDEAKAWIDDNVTAEAYMWIGGTLMAESRYAFDIACGMRDNGFEVKWL
jgi:hypothetical protein